MLIPRTSRTIVGQVTEADLSGYAGFRGVGPMAPAPIVGKVRLAEIRVVGKFVHYPTSAQAVRS